MSSGKRIEHNLDAVRVCEFVCEWHSCERPSNEVYINSIVCTHILKNKNKTHRKPLLLTWSRTVCDRWWEVVLLIFLHRLHWHRSIFCGCYWRLHISYTRIMQNATKEIDCNPFSMRFSMFKCDMAHATQRSLCFCFACEPEFSCMPITL